VLSYLYDISPFRLAVIQQYLSSFQMVVSEMKEPVRLRSISSTDKEHLKNNRTK
jgi:hypothetical protein